MTNAPAPIWPELPYTQWRDTCATLHLWTQIAGKIRLERTPWLNHSWHVPLYVTPRGLTTGPIPDAGRAFELHFDFNQQQLEIAVSDGARRRIALEPRSIADFHATLLDTLRGLGIETRINDLPCEIAGAIRFSEDRAPRSYDAEAARRFWLVLLQVERVMHGFRTGFIGKCSPVHFFWGSFDLAVTRFSGRRAPAFTGSVPGLATAVMREAYSHEVSSAGFWPGGNGIDYAAFYSYAYPAPSGFKDQPVCPAQAFYSTTLGEFLLPYDAVRTAADPDRTLLEFLQSTYAAAATAANWDRAALECPIGVCGVPRET
ncbi:MAG TPA: DUF5996 family protein [Steroidobacteraceae bacterium]|nr:DUF5996 family protein [Steroidobacteraceae bacterium]